ncbi:suppressor of glycerol defect [Knufia fluminis]|uniref:Suppressor of glycerol defect n=1 Tax=Knufia fluminis TaxID=191047 RepID=A0AAN8I419_9EURO|nr:suppressor of glycerol defect [Knufia fluminis]
MSRPKSQRKGPQLPLALQQKLGLPQNNKRQRTQISDRKQKRQEDRRRPQAPPRQDRPAKPGLHHGYKKATVVAQQDIEAEISDDEEESFGEDDLEDLEEPEFLQQPVSMKKFEKRVPTQRSPTPSASPSPAPSLDDDSDSLSRGSREYSPEIVLDAGSRTFKDKQAEEDEEILALEKKLGMKSKQKKQVFDDGYDDILGELDDVVDSKKRKREGRDWLEQKRRKVQGPEEEAEEVDMDGVSASEVDDPEDGGDSFEGFEEEAGSDTSSARSEPAKKKTRENPYIAPAPVNGTSTEKYIPPSRRKPPETDTAKLEKLRRQAQGSLNKLSEANIISIVDEFDKLYQTNPRQDVNTVLIDLLLTSFSDTSALQNTFIILHAAFITALYKILGPDFGAEIISKLVETFDRFHTNPAVTGKESLNLTSLLANLFTFGVVTSSLVYDHIRLLLSSFSEHSAELLLRTMRDCGPQLRSDDPTALKGIVQMMNEVTARMTSNDQPINIRTRVMMDTITDLKNNKIRQATNAAGATGEHLTRMRKALGTLNTRQLRATEPLGVTRSDILNSDKKGKWWLVGASWKGNGQHHQQAVQPQPSSNPTTITSTTPNKPPPNDPTDLSIDYPSLFTTLHLPTPIHRAIFTALTSAEDPTDALARISKLRLTRKQELEIAPVILRAVRAEQTYNPYYGVLSKSLLRERRYKMSFGIALWKFFGVIGERQDEDEDDDDEMVSRGDDVSASEIANVARMYAYLVSRGCLKLDVLKTLNIGFTGENATLFLEVLFVALLTDSKDKVAEHKAVELFSGVEARQAKAVGFFLRKVVRGSDLVAGKKEREKVKKGVKMAVAALAALERDGDDMEGE